MTGTVELVVLITALALFALGLACLSAKAHLIKMVMGIEFCGKGVSLLFILGGSLSGSTGLAQAVVFTLIAIEAVVAGVALALVIVLMRAYGTLDSAAIFRLAGRRDA